jgi:pimeloyl-ACP methyl ester carboxylesterase
MSRHALPLVGLAAAPLLPGCLTLDAFLHNGIPCTEVGAETCAQADNAFDAICTPCAEPYDWAQDYPYHPRLLADGGSVRAVAPELVEVLSLPTRDGAGALDAVLLRAHGEHPERAQITILYNHGNYAGIDHYRVRARYLHELGYTVLIWDYRGYGKTTPRSPPGPEAWFDDAQQVWDEAVARAPDPAKIAVYGYSLGAIPGIEQALANAPCALVLEAPFTGIEAITEEAAGLGMPGSALTTGAYENREKIGAWTGPLLVLAAEEDDLFEVDAVRGLYEAADRAQPRRMEVIAGAVHGVSGGGVPEMGLRRYGELLEAGLAPCGG